MRGMCACVGNVWGGGGGKTPMAGWVVALAGWVMWGGGNTRRDRARMLWGGGSQSHSLDGAPHTSTLVRHDPGLERLKHSVSTQHREVPRSEMDP